MEVRSDNCNFEISKLQNKLKPLSVYLNTGTTTSQLGILLTWFEISGDCKAPEREVKVVLAYELHACVCVCFSLYVVRASSWCHLSGSFRLRESTRRVAKSHG